MRDLQNYSEHFALFFSEGDIFVGSENQFLLPVSATLEALQLEVQSYHIDMTTLIIQCQSRLSEEQIAKAGFTLTKVKSLLPILDATLQPLLVRAYQWSNWDTITQYCGKCAQLLESHSNQVEKKCASCHLSFFPKFSIAIMVLIYREHEILLARSPHFLPGIYSAIAGFVDIGESLEQAAHREVKEELNIEITDLEYFGSQPWPFPNSFMIAFKARYLKGELKVDKSELEDAQWFGKNNFPDFPNKISISRWLIEDALTWL